jgi:hypothetical protein
MSEGHPSKAAPPISTFAGAPLGAFRVLRHLSMAGQHLIEDRQNDDDQRISQSSSEPCAAAQVADKLDGGAQFMPGPAV